MPRVSRELPPPLELLCLRALWQLGEGNVKAVQQIVSQSRPLAYTTIMTVLDRLVRKGMLARRKEGRSFTYAPQATRDAARRAAQEGDLAVETVHIFSVPSSSPPGGREKLQEAPTSAR